MIYTPEEQVSIEKIIHEEMDEFQYMGAGAYKECYAISDNKVIKFCTSMNDTDQEAHILKAAAEAGVSHYFVPTDFYTLDHCFYPSQDFMDYNYYEFEDDDEDNEDYLFNAYEIQTRILSTIYDSEFYDNKFFIENKIPTYGYPKISFKKWLDLAINIYGLEDVRKLFEFFEDYGINDLHRDNLGFMKRDDGTVVPVIIDWLSERS